MTKVLITAFEPFGGERVNPSQLAMERLAGSGLAGVELATALLPVAYYDAADVLRSSVERHDPDVVVCTGQAGGRVAVTPENLAVNRNDTVAPDNAGRAPVDEPIAVNGPAAYFSGLPVREIVGALQAAGIPAEPSWTAGTYVCNHVFYSLMHLIATERPAVQGGFLHVPYAHDQVLGRREPSLALDTITDAVRLAVGTSVAARSRAARPAVGGR